MRFWYFSCDRVCEYNNYVNFICLQIFGARAEISARHSTLNTDHFSKFTNFESYFCDSWKPTNFFTNSKIYIQNITNFNFLKFSHARRKYEHLIFFKITFFSLGGHDSKNFTGACSMFGAPPKFLLARLYHWKCTHMKIVGWTPSCLRPAKFWKSIIFSKLYFFIIKSSKGPCAQFCGGARKTFLQI